jgi:polysaccharide export outer membrane protein
MKKTLLYLLLSVFIGSSELPGIADSNNIAQKRGAVVSKNKSDSTTEINSEYKLGPGDTIEVELINTPEMGGVFTVGPDGTVYLPRLRGLYINNLTVEETRLFLTQQYSEYVKNPKVYVRPVSFRPIRVYVGGEVQRPGYYTLRGKVDLQESVMQLSESVNISNGVNSTSRYDIAQKRKLYGDSGSFMSPTLFDAIRSAEGIGAFSDLRNVEVIRRQALSKGGGRIKARFDFLSMITEGDESQNIQLFDGDIVVVGKSDIVLKDQLIKASRTNLSPQTINVFVTGRVRTSGAISLKQGSSLNQAIGVAGGVRLLRGRVEFLRFLSDGKTDKRVFSYDANAANDTYDNPILADGDIIRVNDSPLSASINVLNEVASPLLGIYSIYTLTYGAFR